MSYTISKHQEVIAPFAVNADAPLLRFIVESAFVANLSDQPARDLTGASDVIATDWCFATEAKADATKWTNQYGPLARNWLKEVLAFHAGAGRVP